ncbi:restriction endonuclease subunit S [uncultured Mucilaginibacter sp.]|uniref:restriction endonuclease subunit S n=1 Tax=uncultured Mucilaginibacter sp. TaxID=797541 RepID=UPI0026013E2B|nr:restriction endonuclease subunit S [uncultured Mucilaginibacter sp.]
MHWKEYKFSDFVTINPQVKLKMGGTYSFVEMKDLEPSNKFCEPSAARLLSGGTRFEENDTLFARITPCLENGKICQVRNLNNGWGFGSTEFHVLRGKENVSTNDFVYYLSRWRDVRDFAEINLHGTSGRQRMPKEAFNELELSLPPLPEQEAIAEVLSSLDDKIDLLHRNNKTLETMAETLFRQWFVEEADDSWEQTTLYDIIELVGGGTPKTENEEYWNGPIKWISAKDITPNHKGFIIKTEKSISESGLKHSSAKVLDKYSIIISARGTVGKYCLIAEPMTFSQSNYGIKPKHKGNNFFTYLVVANSVEELQSAAYGTVFDTITTKTFSELKLNVPPLDEIVKFENTIAPYFFKIEANTKQIHNLGNIRDTLLPKLMNGTLKVNNPVTA